MNKNDLRYLKTEQLLRDSYFRLKKKNKDKRIKISDLCKEAMVNKTTFYYHYETIEDFEKQVCYEEISAALKNCESLRDIFNDTENAVNELVDVFTENKKEFAVLFSGDTYSLVQAVEEFLLSIFIDEASSPEEMIKIKFAVGGASRVLIESNSELTRKILLDLLCKVVT